MILPDPFVRAAVWLRRSRVVATGVSSFAQLGASSHSGDSLRADAGLLMVCPLISPDVADDAAVQWS